MTDASNRRMIFVYQITPDDVIEFVNDAWRRFAAENGAEALAVSVIGSSLWKHFAGAQVIHLSKELLTRVRNTRCDISIPFRCDSPAIKRYMRMAIVPTGKGKVEFRTWIEREEPFRKPIGLIDATAIQDEVMLLRMCAWCKKIDVDGAWFEIEDAISQLRLFDRQSVPSVTHGICEDCLGTLTSQTQSNNSR